MTIFHSIFKRNDRTTVITLRLRTLFVMCLIIFQAGASMGQVISHTWKVIDAGGGRSTGGSWVLSSSIGQPAVQAMTGTGFTLEGGFIPGARLLGGVQSFASITIQSSWNLVSVPLNVSDARKSTIFPTATSQAFQFGLGGYSGHDTLSPGAAYWVKFSSPTTTSLSGASVVVDTISVLAGWNMVGCLSYPLVVASAVRGIGSVNILSQFYGYSAGLGYYPEDTLKPGIGYWVKVNQPGSIVLAVSAGVTPMSVRGDRDGSGKNIVVDPTSSQTIASGLEKAGFRSITLTDRQGRERRLYYSSSGGDVDLQQFELPPVPPGDVFDVRFGSQRYVEAAAHQSKPIGDFPIVFSGGAFPITVSWDNEQALSSAALVLVASDGKRSTHNLNGKGSLTLQSDDVTAAKLQLRSERVNEIPKEFALYQNFPNPFNPTTHVRYDVAKDSRVTLKIYNVLGEELATVINEEQSAGVYSVEFNAAEFSSGVYFYRMHAQPIIPGEVGEFTAVNKFMLMK